MDRVKRHGIPFSDSPRDLRLNLTDSAESGASSAFLHRLATSPACPLPPWRGTASAHRRRARRARTP